MGTKAVPGPQERRFAAYIEGLAKAAGHADRVIPLKNYCTGLLLPGERKSVEPMASRLAPDNVRRMHQSLHHLVADAPWRDEAVLDSVLGFALPAMLQRGPVVAWIVDDTGFPTSASSARRRIDVNLDELDRVLDGARQAPLSESDYEKVKDALHAMAAILES